MKTDTIQFLTQEELEQLLKVIKKHSKRDHAIFYTAYRHGLRASEVGLLQLQDLDLDNFRIRIRRLKGSLSSVHHLSPKEVSMLKSYLRTRKGKDNNPVLFPSNRGTPISRKTLHVMMQKYGELAGIPKEKRKFRVLKHSIATHMLDAGFDIIEVKDWLGHKNIENTMVYAQLTSRVRDELARKLSTSPRIV
ncbi:MAG: tyrosine-type recombinase/integrase [Candidatus Bipolaricaulia bacterium]